MKKVRIIGSYITKFGELWSRSLESLFEEAVFGALDSVFGSKFQGKKVVRTFGYTELLSKFDPSEIEAVFVANMAAGQFANQLHLNALVSQMFSHNPPSFRVEAACASGGMALEMAELALLSGKYKTVLVVGAEKMTDVFAQDSTKILSTASEYQKEYGSTFPALYALLAQAHIQKFGTTRDQLSTVASQNHAHAVTNPNAQFQKEIPIKVVNNSAIIADPLRLFDCSPVSDGAAAVILTTKNIKKYSDKPVIESVGHAQDSLSLADREDLTELKATKNAAIQAYSDAQVGPHDITFAEVHDCFTIAQVLACEDLGFYEKGKAAVAIEKGETKYQKEFPFVQSPSGRHHVVVNPSGGLKACGHPVGATGVKQVAFLANLLQNIQMSKKISKVESVKKNKGIVTKLNANNNSTMLRKKTEQKKIYALTHNVGGSGATAIVHILSVSYSGSLVTDN